MKRPVIHEQKSLFEATVAAEGITTTAGEATGLSLEDIGLAGSGVGSFISMLAVIYPGDPANVDSQDITAFDNGSGEVTVATAFKGGQVPAGTPYKIVTFRFVPAEVAALAADIGDASTSTLGSLYAILGDPAQTFLAMIGYEGATALADKLTAARAALLDEITALRMAELDAGNIPGDIDTLLSRLNALRAGYLDELDFDLQGTLATIAGYIDAEIAALMADVGDASGATLGSILGILGDPAQSFLTMIGYEGATALADKLTAARAGYLDNINNVGLANVIRDVAEATGTFSYDETNAGEQQVALVTITARAKIGGIWLDMVNVTQDTTIRLKHKIDGATLREFTSHAWVTTDSDGVILEGFTAYRDIEITLTCGGGGAGNVNVPYAIV